jgi:hypothetical protein
MCNLFNSFSNAVQITKEVSYLHDAMTELFSSYEQYTVSQFAWTGKEDWSSHGKWNCTWASSAAALLKADKKAIKPKRVGTVSVAFDLFRSDLSHLNRGKLHHGEQALLTCAYAQSDDIDKEYMQFGADGWPTKVDGFRPEANGRLLEWVGDEEKQSSAWVDRAWLFCVPLEKIKSQTEFKNEVARPFWQIVGSNDLAGAFPSESNSCVFPENGFSAERLTVTS